MKLLLISLILFFASVVLWPLLGLLGWLADKCLEKFHSLPEIARWILCWPLSLAVTAIVWLGFLLGNWWVPHILIQIVGPPLCHGVFLGCIHTTVPRGKFGIALTLIILRSLCLAALVLLTCVTVLGASQFIAFDADFWGALLGESAVFCVSMSFLKHMRETREPRNRRKTLRRASEDSRVHEKDEPEYSLAASGPRHHCSS